MFKRCRGHLKQLGPRATKAQIMSADAATLRIGNQKNGWKNVCIHHEANGDPYYCCVRAIGRRIIHITDNGGDGNTWLSAYWEKGEGRRDITDKDIRAGVKKAAEMLDYPGQKGIPIDRIDTHSLRIGGRHHIGFVWVYRHPDTEDGKVAQCYLQGVRTVRACWVLRWHVKGHEEKI